MRRNATDYISFFHVVVVTTVKEWDKDSLQMIDLKKNLMTGKVNGDTPKTGDRVKEFMRLFDRGKRWMII